MRIAFAIVILLFLYDEGKGDTAYKQEAAKVVYSNPAYIKDINIFTYRKSRQSPYLTSCNATTINTWGNNLTVIVECIYARTKQELFSLDMKLCDVIKSPWAKEWLKEYSNAPLACPLAPQKFMFREFELPPKNFPVPLPAGEFIVGVTFVITKTREKLLELKCNIKVASKVGK